MFHPCLVNMDMGASGLRTAIRNVGPGVKLHNWTLLRAQQAEAGSYQIIAYHIWYHDLHAASIMRVGIMAYIQALLRVGIARSKRDPLRCTPMAT